MYVSHLPPFSLLSLTLVHHHPLRTAAARSCSLYARTDTIHGIEVRQSVGGAGCADTPGGENEVAFR
jgi:hypothetical protein